MPGGIPICVLEAQLKLFRVLHYKGKTFSSGGFGVSMTKHEETVLKSKALSSNLNDIQNQEESDDAKKMNDEISNDDEGSSSSSQYLFIEETIFLHERGLLDVYNDQDKKLESHDLYKLLSDMDVPLPIYLAYAHLRSQTFIVLRHTARRLDLVREGSEFYATSSSCTSEDTSTVEGNSLLWKKRKKTSTLKSFRRELREDARNAPPPRICSGDSPGMIAFDVYQPNSAFRKTNPGQPDFCVAVAHYSLPSPTMTEIMAMTTACKGVSLRIATVSDSGTVIMFGISDVGVPLLTKATETTPCQP